MRPFSTFGTEERMVREVSVARTKGNTPAVNSSDGKLRRQMARAVASEDLLHYRFLQDHCSRHTRQAISERSSALSIVCVEVW
jgi:hypothetical protein